MDGQQQTSTYSLTYYRLIALWVLSEAMLGGIIHGLKLPVSGLIVGSCAVVCICLIGWYIPKRGAIIKATMIVAIFKMMLSPQAPPPAYIAVFFQGMMGELLFLNRRLFKLSCLLLAILALVESGLQRIISLMIIYGNDFWKAINEFISGIMGQKTTTNYSLLIGAGYVLLHCIAGIFVGWQASLLPGRIKRWGEVEENKIRGINKKSSLPGRAKKRKLLKKGLLIVWIALILLYVQSYFKIGTPLLPPHTSLKILLRSVIIILSWVFILGPLLMQLLHYWLQKKQSQSQQDIQQVLQLLPATQQLIAESWKRSAGQRKWKRIKSFSKMVLVNALTPLPAGRIFILTAPIQSGKTTALIKWSGKRNDVFGILTPVVNGKRMFMDTQTHHLFAMEAGGTEKDILTVGKFIFSRQAFNKAMLIIRKAMNNQGWLIIDEIGPLELKQEGFYGIVKEILSSPDTTQKILLVVREGLTDNVKDIFQLNEATVINDLSALE